MVRVATMGSVREPIKPRRVVKKKRTKQRRSSRMLDQFLCPISKEPMRRPVLPSSGQAYDEINIVRHCAGREKQRDPVSGAVLKMRRGKGLQRTPEHLLRNLIFAEALKARVYIPPTDKDLLLKHLRVEHRKEAAKAVVDDTYLGYMKLEELSQQLRDLCHDSNQAACEAVYCALVEACLGCQQSPDIVALGAEELNTSNVAWQDRNCLYEALAAAQNPDCRGELLKIIEKKFQDRDYTPKQAMTVLKFYTESVPVQQAKFKISETLLQQGGRDLPCPALDYEDALNLALRVLEELYGCVPESCSITSFWRIGIDALRKMEPGCSLDQENLHRLFALERRDLLQRLAQENPELLEWHLRRHKESMSLLISLIARYDVFGLGGYELELAAQCDSDEDELDSGDDLFDELDTDDRILFRPHPTAFRLNVL